MQSNLGGFAKPPPVPMNIAAARTLDAVARSGPSAPLPGGGRPRMWPDVPWQLHAAFVVFAGLAILLAYLNSFGVKNRPSSVNWTLDNKYIIELDPRTKAEADLFKPSTWSNPQGKPDFEDIWTRDYWWPKGISGLYRPVVTFTYWLNWYKMSEDETKLDPNLSAAQREAEVERIVKSRLLIFHIVNYWSHFLVTILVYLLSLHLTQRFWTAAAIGLLFGLHPVATESVTNIIGRADIFASINVVGGLLLYIRSTLSRTVWKIPWLLALTLLTTVGVFSKESAISVVGAVVLYDLVFRFSPEAIKKFLIVSLGLGVAGYFFHLVAGTLVAGAIIGPVAMYLLIDRLVKNPRELIRDPWASVGVWIVTFGVPVVAMAIVRSLVFGAGTPPETPFLDNPIRGVNWFAGVITALQVLVRLWWILVFPKDLCADYSFNQVPTFGYLSTGWNNAMGLLAAVVVIGVFAFAIYLWVKNYKPAAFFMLFFFVVFLPTSNILITIGSIMAERFLYLPLVGFVGALVLGIEWLINRFDTPSVSAQSETPHRPVPQFSARVRFAPPSWIAPAAFGLLAVIYGVRTYARNFAWQSDVTLWDAAKEISPVSFRSYQSYAFALFEELQKPPEKRQPETKDVTIDKCIEVVTKGRPIVDQLPDRYNSSRLYLHQGMYNGVKAESLCIRNPDGSMTVTPEATNYFKVSIEALERGRRVDRAFNEINRQKDLERGKKLEEIPDAGLLQVYEYLGLSYFRLGMLDQALDNYSYMRHLDPWNADAYEKVATVYLAANRAEQAIIALIQVLWLDPNRRQLWPVLERQLASIDNDGVPPIQVDAAKNPRLNLQCKIVQSTLCSAYQGFFRLYLEAKQLQNAEFIRVMAVRDLGFPQSLFDSIYKEFGVTQPPVIPPKPTAEPAPPGAQPAPQQRK